MQAATSGGLTIFCPVRLDLADGSVLDAVIYLPTDQARPGGVTSVEAVVDGPRDFIPVGIEKGSAILRRDAIRTIEIAADAPGAVDLPDGGGSFDVVTFRLDSGREISGVLRTFAPVEAMRMSDYFNKPERFLALTAGDRVFLVSKAHIVRASF